MSEMIQLSGIDSQKHNQEESFNDDTNDPLPERADTSVCDRPMGRPRPCPDIYLYDGQRARNNIKAVRGISAVVSSGTRQVELSLQRVHVTILTDPSATNYITDVRANLATVPLGTSQRPHQDFFTVFSTTFQLKRYAKHGAPVGGPQRVQGTQANGIDGGNIVGNYVDAMDNEHGFLYSGGTWTTLRRSGREQARGSAMPLALMEVISLGPSRTTLIIRSTAFFTAEGLG